jgi:hypothetical protein
MIPIAAGAANTSPIGSVQFRAAARYGHVEMGRILRDEIDVTIPTYYATDDVAGQFFMHCRGAQHHQPLFEIDDQLSRWDIANAAKKVTAIVPRADPILRPLR